MDFLNRFSLAGKTALITGAEHIYGEEIAFGLKQAGANVCLAGADVTRLNEIAKAIGGASVIEYHQRTEEAAKELAKKVEETVGVPDTFFENNSDQRLEGWNGHSFEEIYDNLQVTQTGMILTVKHIGMLMAKKKAGSVVFVTDVAALVGEDVQNFNEAPESFDHGFALTHGYVRGFYVNYARQAAGYLGENNIRCNAIAYGAKEGTVVEGYAARVIKHSHLKRLLTADDIQGIAVFLASDASQFITGTTIPVDGGYTAK